MEKKNSIVKRRLCLVINLRRPMLSRLRSIRLNVMVVNYFLGKGRIIFRNLFIKIGIVILVDQLMSPIQQTNGHTTATGSKKCLTAETLKILSSTNVDNLTLKSRFELLFNDLSMLQSCAVQGLLAKTSFRFLAWMIFLECIPFEKSEWLQCFKTNRTTFENIRSDVLCDPRNGCAGNVSSNGQINHDNQQMDASRLDTSVNDDHPLSHEKQSIWNKYFSQNKVKCVIEQDVVRM